MKTISHKLMGIGVLMFVFSTLSFFSTPITPVNAQPTEYQLLAPIPLDGPNAKATEKTDTTKYIKGLFQLIIGIATVLAVIMIIFGGIKYMSTDAFGGKSEAKGIIENALWGLLLTMSSWLILYTINPQLTVIDLNIEPLAIQDTGLIPSSLSGQGGSAGCRGNCPYSYVNEKGVVISYKDCDTCSLASTFGLSIKTPTVNNLSVQINTELGNKLKAMRDTSGNPAFTVTEAWPPTVRHTRPEHYEGTTVDVRLATKSAANINTFIKNAAAQGLKAVYEVASESERLSYINQGVSPNNIIPVVWSTGEHFSVYKN